MIKKIPSAPVLALLAAALAAGRAPAAPPPPPLVIGLEQNRKPYSDFDVNQQAHGLAAAALDASCRARLGGCRFVGGVIADLLRDLQNLKLNTVVIIDAALPPGVSGLKLIHPTNLDHLKLTPPLCRLQPAYLQKKTAPARTRPEDFQGAVIGVQAGSLYHQYLANGQDGPSGQGGRARPKPYPLLEAAIVDLVFERIDAVLADRAFLDARVVNTGLAAYAGLAVVDPGPLQLPAAGMTLAVRERDTELLKQLSGIAAATQNQVCAQLPPADAAPPNPN
jgi:ABC-type amino acid transport substrate-binding protein